ncbi:hypothetical protein KEJ32_01010 [Candidatus Bathyarchaeota archaeon]|nr:hypothetical protein [Candidatus Bathyarchaeota archaeon]
MAILQPTNLETADYGTVGWNAIYSSNFQKLNNYLAFLQQAWQNLSASDNNRVLAYDSSSQRWTKRILQGTTNQINITFSSSAITFSLPQDVHTGASPTFNNLTLSGNTLRIATKRTINSSTAPGNPGEICWDDNYIYICIAPNTWRRVPLQAW